MQWDFLYICNSTRHFFSSDIRSYMMIDWCYQQKHNEPDLLHHTCIIKKRSYKINTFMTANQCNQYIVVHVLWYVIALLHRKHNNICTLQLPSLQWHIFPRKVKKLLNACNIFFIFSYCVNFNALFTPPLRYYPALKYETLKNFEIWH